MTLLGRKGNGFVILVKRALGVLEESGVELVAGTEVEGERFGVVEVGAGVLDVLDGLRRGLVDLMMLVHGPRESQVRGGLALRNLVSLDVLRVLVRFVARLLQKT